MRGAAKVTPSPLLSTISVTDHLTAAFPPTLVTVGNADPLRAHTEALVGRLQAAGAPVETVLWPDDQHPPLGHEYQFDLDQEAARTFLDRMLAFLASVTGRRLAPSVPAHTPDGATSAAMPDGGTSSSEDDA